MRAEGIKKDHASPFSPVYAFVRHKLAEIFVAVLIVNCDVARCAILLLQLVEFLASFFIEFNKNILGERMVNFQSDTGRAENKSFLALILSEAKRAEEA